MTTTDAMSHEVPGISVVYPTRNRPEMIVRSLRALLEGDSLPDEIVVVDQSDGDGTRRALEALAAPRVRHVPSSLRGLSNSRNTGIAETRSPIIGFIDDDCFPAVNWLSRARAVIARSPSSSLWIGHDYPTADAITATAIAAAAERWFDFRGLTDPWRVGPTGGNSFFRRETFATVGLFDPLLGQGGAFPGAEDGDMVYRVMKAGLTLTFSDSIRVHHLCWRSEEEELANSHNYGLGVGAMMAKFVATGDYYPLTRIFPRRFLSIYLSIPLWLVLGRRKRLLRNIRWAQSMLQGFFAWRWMHDGSLKRIADAWARDPIDRDRKS